MARPLVVTLAHDGHGWRRVTETIRDGPRDDDQQTPSPSTSIEAQGRRDVGRQVLALRLRRCAGAVPPTRHAVEARACRTEEEGPLIDRLTSQRGKRRQCWPVAAVLELHSDHGSAEHDVECEPQASRNERRDCVMVRAAAGSVPAACPAMGMVRAVAKSWPTQYRPMSWSIHRAPARRCDVRRWRSRCGGP